MDSLLKKAQAKINSLSVKELEKLIPYLSDKYYNEQALVSDDFFDKLVDRLKKIDKFNQVLNNIGAPIRENVEKVDLPIYLGSLDKVKPDTRELELWLERHPDNLVVSDKLDGFSALLEFKSNGNCYFYSRGDGRVGQDISYLLPALKIPKVEKNIFVRGELIISKKTFQEKYRDKYPKARSVVSSVVNAKKPNPKVLRDLNFVAYELYNKSKALTASEQFKILKFFGFSVVFHKFINRGTQKIFQELLKERKKSSPYEVDGLVVISDQKYPRCTERNPKYAVAFKVNEEGVLTTVLEVDWQASKHGILIPRLKFSPIILDGDNVQYCTAFHANFIRDNKVGPGSKIKVVKSGDVIPYVTEVVKGTKAFYPDVKYHWNETEIDIILDEITDEVRMKRLINFFKALDIKGVDTGVIKKLMKAGYDTISKIYHAQINDLTKLNQTREKSAATLYNNIHDVLDKKINLAKLMNASMIFGFGFGEKKFILLLDQLRKILKREDITLTEIKAVEGFSSITAEKFVNHYHEFWQWLDEHRFLKYYYPKNEVIEKGGKYMNQFIVFTGFRNNNLKAEIESQGGKVQNGINNKTTLVLTKDKSGSGSKLVKAREMNIPIEEII